MQVRSTPRRRGPSPAAFLTWSLLVRAVSTRRLIGGVATSCHARIDRAVVRRQLPRRLLMHAGLLHACLLLLTPHPHAAAHRADQRADSCAFAPMPTGGAADQRSE